MASSISESEVSIPLDCCSRICSSYAIFLGIYNIEQFIERKLVFKMNLKTLKKPHNNVTIKDVPQRITPCEDHICQSSFFYFFLTFTKFQPVYI